MAVLRVELGRRDHLAPVSKHISRSNDRHLRQLLHVGGLDVENVEALVAHANIPHVDAQIVGRQERLTIASSTNEEADRQQYNDGTDLFGEMEFMWYVWALAKTFLALHSGERKQGMRNLPIQTGSRRALRIAWALAHWGA